MHEHAQSIMKTVIVHFYTIDVDKINVTDIDIYCYSKLCMVMFVCAKNIDLTVCVLPAIWTWYMYNPCEVYVREETKT